MRRPWLLVGGIIVVVVGIAGLVLPVIPGIALLIVGGVMIRAAVTGETVDLRSLRRRVSEPLPEAADG